MLAEEELNAIFNKSAETQKTAGHSSNFQLNYGSSLSTGQSTSHSNTADGSNNEVGFSNFGHFRAPIKRPSCNPMIKDERFKSLNDVNSDYRALV